MRKLSIVIPIYNVEKYIGVCLGSIFSQKVRENVFEVIIVNDGTPDKSMEVVRGFEYHDNLVIVNQSNQGLSVARNTGLSKAEGEYVWFVDSDDCLLTGALERVLHYLSKFPGIDVLASVLELMDERTRKTYIEYKPHKSFNTGREYLFVGNNLGATQRYILRRQFLLDNNLAFMPDVYHEDGEFGPKMLYLAKSIVLIDKPVYCYLQRDSGSIMSNRKMKMNYDLIKIYYSLEKFRRERVGKKDEWRFKAVMYTCLECTILFSRRQLDSEDFMTFYDEYKGLIHEKARELLRHPFSLRFNQLKRIIHFYFFPLSYDKLKLKIKS